MTSKVSQVNIMLTLYGLTESWNKVYSNTTELEKIL